MSPYTRSLPQRFLLQMPVRWLLQALDYRMAAAADACTDVFLELFSEWYGIPPHWSRLADVKGQAFETLWTTLWFAKGQLTSPLDARLREKYGVTRQHSPSVFL